MKGSHNEPAGTGDEKRRDLPGHHQRDQRSDTMAGDHVGLVRRHDMDGWHGKDGRRGLGGHDLRSWRHHRSPEHDRRRHHPRHRILRHPTGGRAEPDGRDARGHRTVEPPSSRPVGHRGRAGPVPHDGSDDGPAAPDGMERQSRRGRVRGGPPRPRPAPSQPHAERGRARAAPLRVLRRTTDTTSWSSPGTETSRDCSTR